MGFLHFANTLHAETSYQILWHLIEAHLFPYPCLQVEDISVVEFSIPCKSSKQYCPVMVHLGKGMPSHWRWLLSSGRLGSPLICRNYSKRSERRKSELFLEQYGDLMVSQWSCESVCYNTEEYTLGEALHFAMSTISIVTTSHCSSSSCPEDEA